MKTSAEQALHYRIAEQGKLLALKGDHIAALRHYRQAMALAVRTKQPEVVFRHYLECSLESLELMGAYEDIIAYCNRAIDHYQQNPPQHELAHRDLAAIQQRRGVALLKQGGVDDAIAALTAASSMAQTNGYALPLADTLLGWLRARLVISSDRLAAEQRRHRYFAVRPDTVRPEYATELPATNPQQFSPFANPRGGISNA